MGPSYPSGSSPNSQWRTVCLEETRLDGACIARLAHLSKAKD